MCYNIFLVSPAGSVSFIKQYNEYTVTLTCTASGGPSNRFEWKNLSTGTVLSNSAVYQFATGNNVGGNYQCTVFNEAGNGTAIVDGKFKSFVHIILYI